MPYGLDSENKLYIELEVDGLTYRCAGFRTKEIALHNLEEWQRIIPNKLEHKMRVIGFTFSYEEIYKWCGTYKGKLYKSFMGDFEIALRSILNQWRKDEVSPKNKSTI